MAVAPMPTKDEQKTKPQLVKEIRALRRQVRHLEKLAAERERTEAQLRQLSRAVEQSASLVLITDTQGRIEYVNPKFTELTGYTLNQVLTRNPRLLKSGKTPPEDYESLWRTISAGKEWRGELLNRKKNGELFWGSAVISPIRNGGGVITHFLEVMEDITERRRLEEAIVSASEGERRIIGQELHDVLGQELTGIMLLAKALERKLAAGELKGHSDAAGIAELAAQALREVRDLSHGLYPAELERNGLRWALEELANNQERLFHVPCLYRGDRITRLPSGTVAVNLYRIAQEAVNNAIKHGKPQRIEIRLTSTGDYLTLSVEDDGCGIGELRPDNHGLGLRIMRYRASVIGAALEIRRGAWGGTLVTCTLHNPAAGAPRRRMEATRRSEGRKS